MSVKKKLRCGEDKPSLAQIIRESLETRHFNVIVSSNVLEALKIFDTKMPEVLVFYVMMPKKDGFTVAKEIRKTNPEVPILFLTAKSQTKDVVEGFDNGGNDYLKKPFSMEELIVRVYALLERFPFKQEKETYKIGKYLFNHKQQTLAIDKTSCQLTHIESELLLVLVQQKNKISERTFILNKLW